MGICQSKVTCNVPSSAITPPDTPPISRRGSLRVGTTEELANAPAPRTSTHRTSSLPRVSLENLQTPLAANSALAATQVLNKAKGSLQQKTPNPAVASFDAPLREVSEDQFKDVVKNFRRDIQNWKHPQSNLAAMPAGWHTRVSDALKMLASVIEPTGMNIGYFVGTRAMGLMCLENMKAHIEVTAIVTHPATEGCGGSLIERAASVAEQSGCNGLVKLNPAEGAINAYQALGFEGPDEDGNMTLDPRSNPELWVQRGNDWRLRKHEDKTYLTATLDSAPLGV